MSGGRKSAGKRNILPLYDEFLCAGYVENEKFGKFHAIPVPESNSRVRHQSPFRTRRYPTFRYSDRMGIDTNEFEKALDGQWAKTNFKILWKGQMSVIL